MILIFLYKRINSCSATRFENLKTCSAIQKLCFKDKHVDAAVLCVGLGFRNTFSEPHLVLKGRKEQN